MFSKFPTRRRSPWTSTGISARELGLGQQTIASDVLVSLNNSLQVAPNFWLDPKNGVSYPLVVQTPTYDINSAQDLWTLPVTSPSAKIRSS